MSAKKGSMHEFQDELDRDLRRSAPGTRLSDDFKRNLRLTLKSRYPRRRPSLLLPAVVFASGLALLLANNHEVGSDDGKLQQTGVTVEGEPIYGSWSMPKRFVGSPDMTIKQYEDWNWQLAANGGEFYAVEGLLFKGRANWIVFDDINIEGHEGEGLCRDPEWPPHTMVEKDGAFYECCYDSLMEMIENDEAEYMGTFTMRVDDTLCRMKEWRAYFEGYGAVHLYRGQPIR